MVKLNRFMKLKSRPILLLLFFSHPSAALGADDGMEEVLPL